MDITLMSESPKKTREIGLILGQTLKKNPAVLLLKGDLGSGKTTLSKAIVAGLGLSDLVTSPTFSLMNVYGGGQVYHFDLYRLQDEEELTEIGFEEILDEKVPVLIEWPEMLRDYPFEKAVMISLTYCESSEERKIRFMTENPVLLEGLKGFE